MLGAQRLGVGDLHQRCGLRHDNETLDTHSSGREGNALGMIPGRGRDHSTGLLFVGELEDLVESSSRFERARVLKGLEL